MVEGFTEGSFTHDGVTHPVYRRGHGPGVVVIHEIPGIIPEVVRFANLVAEAGFTVSMPELFGTAGRPFSTPYVMSASLHACVSREFHVLQSRGSSPVTDWLRALCRDLHRELGGKGVGAIGMCLTGNFALAMSVDDAMMAPVLSQPSLPFAIDRGRGAALHVSDEALVTIKRRCESGELRVLGLRFTCDRAVPKARFDHLRAELGDAFEAVEIDSSPGNPHGISKKAHSVLTRELVDRQGHPTKQALERVLSFFRERLG